MSLPPDKPLFKNYHNPFMVETGSWLGDSINAALKAGFKDIRAIEIDATNVALCRKRFENKPVSIFHGDSALILWDVIKEIEGQITFWLDGHWNFFEGTEKGENPFPLLKELEQIARHPIKTHTIIIDDWHIFYEDLVGYSKQDIKNAILQINKDYQFTPVANPVISGIMIASVK